MSDETQGGAREILNSWKEIAGYVDRGVRTQQRWEELGMPVRRFSRCGNGMVFAFRSELDAWLRQSSAVDARNEVFSNGDATESEGAAGRTIFSGTLGRTAQLILRAEEIWGEMLQRREHVYEAIAELHKTISNI